MATMVARMVSVWVAQCLQGGQAAGGRGGVGRAVSRGRGPGRRGGTGRVHRRLSMLPRAAAGLCRQAPRHGPAVRACDRPSERHAGRK
jgi:hypothetical protein